MGWERQLVSTYQARRQCPHREVGSSERVGFTNSPHEAGGSATDWWGGPISDVAIYNSALTSSQVKTLYNGREPYNHKEGVASGNLAAWWRMGDGNDVSGSPDFTISDMSANSNNGATRNVAGGSFKGDTP